MSISGRSKVASPGVKPQAEQAHASLARRQESPKVWISFAEVRSQVSREQVLAQLNWLERMRGTVQRRGPCPVQGSSNEQSRSFAVHMKKNVFCCHSPKCAAQGDVINLWAAVHHLTLHDAAVDLARTFQLKTGSREEEPV